MGQPQEPDEELMRQVAQGGHEPLSVLLRRHATPLLTFLRRMTHDVDRSEELFQEVFLAVWSSREKYQYPRPFRPWLFGIALNKCRADRRQRGESPLSLEDCPGAAPLAPDSSPLDGAVATETAAQVEQAVLRLPARQRAVVVLRTWNGLSYAEIADALGGTEGTVRSNMFHGLAALRKYLGRQLGLPLTRSTPSLPGASP
jgi:RNA polymerase sigma-70 factor (ECF subfamily)